MGVASVKSSDKVRESPIKKQDSKKDIKQTKGLLPATQSVRMRPFSLTAQPHSLSE